MDIFVDNEKIFSLSEDELKILQFGITKDMISSDIKRRLNWVIRDQHLTYRFREMKQEWESILIQRGAKSLPTDMVEYSKLVIQQPDYKDADAKQAEFLSKLAQQQEGAV